jgi:hypothetical protein
MIKLKEIVHKLRQEENKGLTPLDNWKITDYDFMTDMDFKPDGQYSFALKNPHIRVYHKKGIGFVVEDYSKTSEPENAKTADYNNMPQKSEEEKNKPIKRVFPSFSELTDYFTKYEQRFANEPYKS